MKIAIIGLSGAGKSTFAKNLGQEIGIEPLHLDTLHFLPGWQERAETEEIELFTKYLDTHQNWIIEGNYSHLLMQRRLQEADQIYVLLAPRLIRLFRVCKRWLKYRGTTRSSMADGCPEKLDLEFIKWVLLDSTNRQRLQNFYRIKEEYPAKTRLFRWYKW